MEEYTIGLDVGTTGLKGVLVDDEGQVVSKSEGTYPLKQPHPGWSEQDPQDWWTALQTVTKELTSLLPRQGKLCAVGLSGQMHGSVFLDSEGKILYPAILWNDQRTDYECQEILDLTQGQIIRWTSNPPRTAFTATKILWARRHLPKVYRSTAHVVLPKDYLRYRLTGEFVTEVTDASGTNLLDVSRRAWSEEVFAALDIPMEWMGRVVESPEITGYVSQDAAQATMLPEGTPVVGGGADQATAAIGNGVAQEGILSITLGTSGVVYVQMSEMHIDPSGALHTFCHAVPGMWQMMAGVLSAGGSLRWYRDVVAEPEVHRAAEASLDPYDEICRMADAVSIGAGGLIFLPYLTGERCPHADPRARGTWFGLTSTHHRGHLSRAILEGTSYALRDLVSIIHDLGVRINEVRVAGGGARSRVWLQILADILNQPLLPSKVQDASAFGAAILAASAGGRSLVELCSQWVRTEDAILPNSQAHERYNAYYRIFRHLYPATRELMHELTDLETF